MIATFEEYTHELTPYEHDVLLPVILKGLMQKKGKENAVTNKKMAAGLKAMGYEKICGPRIRKIINYIRTKHLIDNLIGSSKGYWISQDPEEIKLYKQTLQSRINAIQDVLNSYK